MICGGEIINELDFISLGQSRDRFQLADEGRVHDKISNEVADDDAPVSNRNSLIELDC